MHAFGRVGPGSPGEQPWSGVPFCPSFVTSIEYSVHVPSRLGGNAHREIQVIAAEQVPVRIAVERQDDVVPPLGRGVVMADRVGQLRADDPCRPIELRRVAATG
jgi:hypothetical protein